MTVINSRCIYIFLFAFLANIHVYTLEAQEKKIVYFKLKKGGYSKGISERPVVIKTTRNVLAYGFTISCKCTEGNSGLWFYGHNNPETGQIFEPIRIIDKEQLKDIKFMNFDDLLALLKKEDNLFNKNYKLYFVEAGRNIAIYHVAFGSTFGTEQRAKAIALILRETEAYQKLKNQTGETIKSLTLKRNVLQGGTTNSCN